MVFFEFARWNGMLDILPQGKANEPLLLFPTGLRKMIRLILLAIAAFQLLSLSALSSADEILFEDTFDEKLSPQWKAVGLKEDEYRIKDGGLEMRVFPANKKSGPPMLMVHLPFTTNDTVTASVELSLIDRFTEPAEAAGLYLTDENSREFAAEKKNINGFLVFSPGKVEFIGKAGTGGDPQQFALKFWPANEEFGPLRIIVRGGNGFFQAGPSKEGEYLNFFHSALRDNEPKRGFCLSTSGGPTDKEHWVRFDNFRVIKN
jgi:hypothetical protein